jgi:hypothetical protein
LFVEMTPNREYAGAVVGGGWWLWRMRILGKRQGRSKSIKSWEPTVSTG